MDLQNLKLPLGIVLLILAQAFGVIWYVSGLDANVKVLNTAVARINNTERNGSGEIPQDVYWQLDDLWREIENSSREWEEVRFQLDTYYFQIEDINIRIQDLERRVNELLDHRWN